MKTNINKIVKITIAVAALIFIIVTLAKSGSKEKAVATSPVDPMHAQASVSAGAVAISDLTGKLTPQFSLQDRDGVVYTPESLNGKNVVMFFNEGLMCYPSCWNQIVALSTDARFQGGDTIALAIVTDKPGDWQQAIAKMPELGKATTLFDTDRSVSTAFGMLTAKSSMHYGQLPGHSYVILDKTGIVRYVFDDPNMAVNNDRLAEELSKLK